MSIHCIELVCDSNADAALVQPTTGFIAVWLNNFTAWEVPGQTNENVTLRDAQPALGIPEHYRAPLWRFEWSESRALLLDNLEGHVSARTNWYRMRYHECFHDEDSPSACEWDEIRTGGTVPSGV